MERKRGERYSQKFRGQTVERMNACENILRLSRELGIHRRLLYKWRSEHGAVVEERRAFNRLWMHTA